MWMKKVLLLISCVLFFGLRVFAQDKTVTGLVKGQDDGLPIPGVSVTINGTHSGVITGGDGKFSISAPQGSTLHFSFMGYAPQQRIVGAGNTLNIMLSTSGRQLGEVTVTGALGITRTRNQQSYAAQQVTGEEVNKTRASNFVDGLSGKVAGLEIRQNNALGASVNVVLRGVKSITGNNQALFVIDGVPVNNENQNNSVNPDPTSPGSTQQNGSGGYDYGSPASDINPDDIESVTVLKGAGASALYGSRGSNGVILITTKKAKKGLGITINATVSQGSLDKSTFPKFQHSYGAGYGNYYSDPTGHFFYGDVLGNGQMDLVTPTTEDASYGAKFDPKLMVYQWDAFDKTSPNYHKATPWVAAKNDPTTFFVKPISNSQSLFITNGGDNGTFKLGFTRNDENGIVPNSEIIKNSIDFGSTYNVNKRLTAGANINFYNTVGKGRPGTGYDGASDRNVMTNFREWWEVNNDVQELKAAYNRTGQNVTWNYSDPLNGNLKPIFWDNPYYVRYQNYESDTRNRYLGNANLNYKATDWLNILGRVSLDSYTELDEERRNVSSVGVPYYSRYNHSYTETNYDLLANADHTFGKFNLKGVLGTNIRVQNNQSISAVTNGGLIIPSLYSLSNSLNAPSAPVEHSEKREVDGVFGGATITYNKLLTADVTLRRDQSSTLPAGSNVYYYPSIAGGFIFSELLGNLDWLSYGKLRANYAQVGNDAPIYSTNDTYKIFPPFGSNPQTYSNTTKNNPSLKPERTSSKEVGLELSFLKGRLGFDGSYYSSLTSNEILPVNVSTATGYSFKYLNAGSVRNNGIELSLTAVPVKTADFRWNINVNYTRARNRVMSLFTDGSGTQAQNLVVGQYQGGITINASLHEPFGMIRGTDYTYLNGQRLIDANGKYIKTSTSNHDIGNSNPDWIGGINNSFTYRNFSLSFLIDIRKGGSVFSTDMYYGLATGLYPETVFTNDLGNPVRNTLATGGGFIRKGVTQDGKANTKRVDDSNFQQLGYSINPDKAFVYDASYVKLREALIGYSLGQKAMHHLGPLKEVTIQLIGRNLWIIHKNLPYSDPEEGLSSGNLQGYQVGAYPTTRTLSANLKIRF